MAKFLNASMERLRRVVRRVRYRGSLHCPLCASGFDEFESGGFDTEVSSSRKVVGMGNARNVCPVCSSKSRTRLTQLYLRDHVLSRPGGKRILHFAPEYPLYAWLRLFPEVDHVCCDLTPEVYHAVGDVEQADITALKYDDRAYDAVICSHVMEHVPDDMLALSELYRVLRPGGQALLLAPFAIDELGTDEDLNITDEAERERRFGQSDHVRLYTQDDFVARVEKTGFSVSLYDFCAAHPQTNAVMGLDPREVLVVAKRPL